MTIIRSYRPLRELNDAILDPALGPGSLARGNATPRDLGGRGCLLCFVMLLRFVDVILIFVVIFMLFFDLCYSWFYVICFMLFLLLCYSYFYVILSFM